jgi:hypothetical protein
MVSGGVCIMKVNVFARNPEKIEEAFKVLQDGLSKSMVAGKVVFIWNITGSGNGYRAYECEFTYENQNRVLDKIVFSQFEGKLRQIDSDVRVKKV